MKIGILTYHHVMNYGAMLQAYALSRYLRDCGHSVETIDYRPTKAIEAYRKAFFENNPYEREHRVRQERFDDFLRREIPLSPRPFETREGFDELRGRYACTITGSDEVWNINSFRGYDPSYFLDFAEGGRRVAYAATFGFTATTGAHRGEITRLLSAFSALGVRDEHTMRILRDECGLSSVKTVDPTLLLDSYERVAVPPPESGYVLVYANCSEAEAEYVRRFAERVRKPVVAIAYPLAGAINKMELSPAEWIGYYAAADYIFNGFFHGIIFSLIYRKPFTAFLSSSKAMKMGDLLSDIGLSSRLVKIGSTSDPLPDPELDYSESEPRLARARDESRAFLRTALATSPS
ncbi:MAG: polysaccharide pyruvyl transferase family protein [Kiritimatiellae bacterium]|nr:polysaccharide pyruvyl transferase family protein [Kiritimatiellia bacterium]MDW8459048.1 polysaccharide pyruvyl transferase family protein [Verrucomicrobiota bacterium]